MPEEKQGIVIVDIEQHIVEFVNSIDLEEILQQYSINFVGSIMKRIVRAPCYLLFIIAILIMVHCGADNDNGVPHYVKLSSKRSGMSTFFRGVWIYCFCIYLRKLWLLTFVSLVF